MLMLLQVIITLVLPNSRSFHNEREGRRFRQNQEIQRAKFTHRFF